MIIKFPAEISLWFPDAGNSYMIECKIVPQHPLDGKEKTTKPLAGKIHHFKALSNAI